MHLQSNAHQRRNEYRRYFPDWTHRSLRIGNEVEADHNSYLAGGYAEEFGYPVQAQPSRGATLIDGAGADDDALRLVQWAGLHPGYPLRPHPISVDREKRLRQRVLSRSSSGVSHLGKLEVRDRGTFVSVAERLYERKHRRLASGLVGVVMRFLAAGAGLRRKLPAQHRKRQ